MTTDRVKKTQMWSACIVGQSMRVGHGQSEEDTNVVRVQCRTVNDKERLKAERVRVGMSVASTHECERVRN